MAYLVGGSVRDFLLKRETKDHDIATSATPDELEKLFPHAVLVGKQFGVIKIPLTYEESPHAQFLEIATFRKDLEYKDGRHPTGVAWADPVQDAKRRDFTINALFYDPKTNRILDCCEGIKDLESKRVRAIGVPADRFKEDALRLLRAVRFTTALRFTLDEATAEAAKAKAKLIARISGERIRDELNHMLEGPDPANAFSLLSELGILDQVLPELSRLRGVKHPAFPSEGDFWKFTLRLLEAVRRQNPVRPAVLMWAALLSRTGIPTAAKKNAGKSFNGFPQESARISIQIAERLHLSKSESELIRKILEEQLNFRGVFQMREATIQRLIRAPHFDWQMSLFKADSTITDGNLAQVEFLKSRFEDYRRNPEAHDLKLISGEDLIELGFSPGPQFSEMMKNVEDLVLEKKLKTKEEAQSYIIEHYAKKGTV
ncbi:MAG: CCA tRNA nucleotidyltransferase [Bdellovibrionales bacterium]|nr:CCA tRNA nucleotidyltransferase [Bdellovibrionales bacterium]